MSWATAAGLGILLAFVWGAARLWRAICEQLERRRLYAELDAARADLEGALRDDPDNLSDHLRHRARIKRLQEQLDALG